MALAHLKPAPNLPTDLLLFLGIVVGAALIGGFVAGVATAIVSFPVINWFLTVPLHTFRIEGGEDFAALTVFFFVAIVVSALVDQVAKRSADAERARDEAAEFAITAAKAEAASEGDRLRTAILRAVSHDLRTPLASIKASSTSLLQDDIEWSNEARKDFALTIDEEADRLDRIVGNLLDLSRLDAGVVQPDFIAVRVSTALHDALSSLGPIRCNFESKFSDPDLEVTADSVLLERVLANIASNAVRHGSSNGPIQITAHQNGDLVHITVADHGPGMSSEDRVRAFEPFMQLGDQSGGAGTGLGLAVAKGFTEAMNGFIHLEETPGGGLTAIISLQSSAQASVIRSQPFTAR
ncbi:unannotated protein [freshwater metagenome]|uniref:Unannotated protein n=1 Tax=freshwater metagenome TaxID=449393 RepID=A0A6J6XTS6_9ZZZZ